MGVMRARGLGAGRVAIASLALALSGFAPAASAADRPWTNPFALTTPASPASTVRDSKPKSPGVYVDRLSVGLGEAVTVTVIRPPAPAPLDLSALAAGFEVREVNRGEREGREQWTLLAYPRTTGRHAVPSWGLRGRAATVDVTDGAPGAPRVRLRLSADAQPLRERESAMLTLEACSDGALQWQRPALASGEGALLRPLGQTEVQAEVDGLRCTATRWHWAMLPTSAGTLHIRPPTLQGTRFGRILRLPAPETDFEVTAVPRWLPPEVAVGPLAVEVQAATGAVAIVGEPWPLRLRLRGNLSPESVRQLLQVRLAAQPEWSRYPVEVTAVPDRSATPSWDVILHALPEHAGRLVWPALDWTWFDPSSQQLRSVRSDAVRVEVDDPERRRWLQGAAIVATVLVGAAVASWLWRRQAWRWRRWRLTRDLRRLRTAGELRRRLLAFRLEPGREDPERLATLVEWKRAVEASSRCADPAPWLEALQRLLYAAEADEGRVEPELPQPLVRQVRDWLRTAEPRRGPRVPAEASAG